jgi:hypothetical protein
MFGRVWAGANLRRLLAEGDNCVGWDLSLDAARQPQAGLGHRELHSHGAHTVAPGMTPGAMVTGSSGLRLICHLRSGAVRTGQLAPGCRRWSGATQPAG